MEGIFTLFAAFGALGILIFGFGFAITWTQRVFAAVADLE